MILHKNLFSLTSDHFIRKFRREKLMFCEAVEYNYANKISLDEVALYLDTGVWFNSMGGWQCFIYSQVFS